MRIQIDFARFPTGKMIIEKVKEFKKLSSSYSENNLRLKKILSKLSEKQPPFTKGLIFNIPIMNISEIKYSFAQLELKVEKVENGTIFLTLMELK